MLHSSQRVAAYENHSQKVNEKKRNMITEKGRSYLKNLILGGNPFCVVHLKLLKPEVFRVMNLEKNVHNHSSGD